MTHRTIQHNLRQVTDHSGIWGFSCLVYVNPGKVNVTKLAFTDFMAVPGCFDATPMYAGKRGLSTYRKRIYLPETGRYRLAFNGVNHWCSVWITGNQETANRSKYLTGVVLDR